jgi:hypothetical protein
MEGRKGKREEADMGGMEDEKRESKKKRTRMI